MPHKDPEARKAFMREWLRKRRAAWLAENGPCVKCGSSRNLEVDHIDPAQKVSHRIWGWCDEKRLAELAKCQVLCCKCHKAKTREQRRVALVHGTNRGYNGGCRCEPCRLAARAHQKAWRDANKDRVSAANRRYREKVR